MLNSLHLANNHYSLKLKSMFDLAIATQRYSPSHQQQQQQPPPPQVGYSIHHQQYPPAPLSHHHQQSKHLVNNNRSGFTVSMMDECGGVRDEGQLLYPRSPQSESSPKSRDSCPSPNALPESATTSITRSDMSPSSIYNNNNNNSLISNTSHHLQQQSLISQDTMVSADDRNGKQGGKKQGSGGAPSISTGPKPSFSIESLLAHSNNWRRHHPTNDHLSGKGGSVKDSRFVPYSVPLQTQQQQSTRTSSRQQHTESSITSKNPSSASSIADNEKRADAFTLAGKSSGGNANNRRATKSKRVRTIFTPEQLERLEAEFERQQYMVGPERLYLASSLYLTEAQVKVWFQNRRIKWRKQHLEMEQQRLAIYRTLAEQDMMASVEEEDPEDDSADCDYDIDDSRGGGGDDDRRSLHSPSQQQIGGSSCSSSNNSNLGSAGHQQSHNNSFSLTSSVLDKVNPIDHPSTLHHGNLSPNSSPIRRIKPLFPNNNKTSGGSVAENRLRVPLQQTSTNEDYDTTISSSITSSSSPQPSASFLRTCKDHPGSKK